VGAGERGMGVQWVPPRPGDACWRETWPPSTGGVSKGECKVVPDLSSAIQDRLASNGSAVHPVLRRVASRAWLAPLCRTHDQSVLVMGHQVSKASGPPVSMEACGSSPVIRDGRSARVNHHQGGECCTARSHQTQLGRRGSSTRVCVGPVFPDSCTQGGLGGFTRWQHHSRAPKPPGDQTRGDPERAGEGLQSRTG